MTAPDTVLKLVEQFDRNRTAYTTDQYKEAQLRIEFVNPFFESLGWDISNRQGYAEAYKDVINEDAIKIEGKIKAPDYCFRIGGTRKFFVEAKQPKAPLKEAKEPAFQLRRYAWSAKLPLSILTDFEEFVIYDCRVKPDRNDQASTARLKYFTYLDYQQKWDDIASIFSREAILKGSFDAYAESTKGKKGTAEVDDAFLQEIESWREILARHLALRNKQLRQRELNYAVQMTIDRIIFLRICEDRGIEEYEQLKALLKGTNVYERLCKHFVEADERYNSGLFHFQKEKDVPEPPDKLTPHLIIDDKPLKDVLKQLYYPESPYEFSVLPADVLGQVYEQFLGKAIRLTATHQVQIEEKPEVRKAGGVYYTPTYIVEYIVRNTVGKLVQGKTPKQIEKIKILDPACGSGSFLLEAYQFLLNYHRDYYVSTLVDSYFKGKNPVIFQTDKGEWKLTSSEKRRILLSNIFGVDIDSQAVEVTKLSLLLKVLEGENQETLQKQLSLFRERALPDLEKNIKCGNSLIGNDFYQQNMLELFDEEQQYKINAFDWIGEFRAVMDNGGFDVVIGNPPYGALFLKQESEYLRLKYSTASYQVDSYPIFVEKSLALLKEKGFCGVIIPSAWVASKFNISLRRSLVEDTTIQDIVITPKKTFKAATVETLIIIVSKHKQQKNSISIDRWDNRSRPSYTLSQEEIRKSPDYLFPVYSEPATNELIAKLFSYPKLGEYVEVVWGVKIYQKGKGEPKQKGFEADKRIFHVLEKTKPTHRPLLGGKEIGRYVTSWNGTFVDYGNWLAEPRSPDWFNGARILVREVTANGIIQATLVTDEFVFSNSVDGVRLKKNTDYKLEYLLGIINSKLISYYHLNTSANAFKGTFPKLLIKDILGFPITQLNLTAKDGRAKHDALVSLVQTRLNLGKRMQSTLLEQEKNIARRQIESIEKEVDRVVYEMYCLTEEEIRMVETGFKESNKNVKVK